MNDPVENRFPAFMPGPEGFHHSPNPGFPGHPWLSVIFTGFAQLFRRTLTKQTEAYLLGRGKLAEIITGAERAQEGTFPEPWSDLHWRYEEERPAAGFRRRIMVVWWEGFLGDKQIVISSLEVE